MRVCGSCPLRAACCIKTRDLPPSRTARNTLESELRKMVKSIIKIAYKNESAAKDYVVKKLYAGDRKLSVTTYNELFDPRACNIYLKHLIDLIKANWDYFSDYFGKQDIFIAHANVLNAEGRFDAHATVPSDDEMNAVNNAIKYMTNGVTKYKQGLE